MRILIVTLLLCVTTLLASSAAAYPVHRRLYEVEYQKQTHCTLCHDQDGGSDRNGYGRDWAKEGEDLKAFRTIAERDSDGDGFSNSVEIAAGSNPGEAKSTPDKPGRRWARKPKIPIPTDLLRLVMSAAERMEALEPVLSDAQVAAIEKGAGAKLQLIDKYPTLYFGTEDGRRTQVGIFRQFQFGKKGAWFSLLIAVDEAAKVKKIAMFRAGDGAGTDYVAFTRCLVGFTKSKIPDPGDGGCPKIKGRVKQTRRIAAAVRTALWTVGEVLSAAPQPGAASASTSDSRGTPPTEVSSSPDAPLDFSKAKPTESTTVYASSTQTALVLLTIALLIGLILVTVRFGMRNSKVVDSRLRISDLPPSLKILTGLAFFSFLLVQAVGGTDAYIQTQVANESTLEYFQYLSWARLLGMSHSHLFGFAVVFGVIGFIVSMTSASERIKCVLIATALWSGIFDVVSWWGIKGFSPRFHYLSFVCGAGTGIVSLVAGYLIIRSLLEGRHSAEEEDEPSLADELDGSSFPAPGE